MLILLAALAWPLRVLLALLVASTGVATVWRFVLLRGRRGLRAVEWLDGRPDEPPLYFVWLGSPALRLPALPNGCQRYGTHLWILGFETAQGACRALVDARRQEPRAFRRLSRRLVWGRGPPFGPSGGGELLPSRPKV